MGGEPVKVEEGPGKEVKGVSAKLAETSGGPPFLPSSLRRKKGGGGSKPGPEGGNNKGGEGGGKKTEGEKGGKLKGGEEGRLAGGSGSDIRRDELLRRAEVTN